MRRDSDRIIDSTGNVKSVPSALADGLKRYRRATQQIVRRRGGSMD